MKRESWSDQRIEDVIGYLLRGGVMLSAAVVSCGAVVYLLRHGGARPEYGVFHGEPSELRSLIGIIHNAFAGHGRGIIQLGLLLLIATPVARVAFSIWGFAEERDHMYTVFTVIVLAILLYSLLGSG
jgi:uncharacterized membrane protein